MSTAKKTVSRSTSLPGESSPAAQWFARLGLSGKLLLFGGVAGVIVAFFPLVSFSGNTWGFQASAMVIDDWRGLLGVVGYLAAIVLAVLLYPADRAAQRNHLCAAVGLGALLVLVGTWLFITAVRTGSGLELGETGVLRAGLGVLLNLVTAATVAAGTLWKAREEKLV